MQAFTYIFTVQYIFTYSCTVDTVHRIMDRLIYSVFSYILYVPPYMCVCIQIQHYNNTYNMTSLYRQKPSIELSLKFSMPTNGKIGKILYSSE